MSGLRRAWFRLRGSASSAPSPAALPNGRPPPARTFERFDFPLRKQSQVKLEHQTHPEKGLNFITTGYLSDVNVKWTFSHQLAGIRPRSHARLKMEPLNASPHGHSLGGSGCGRRGAPQWVDEASELQRHIHFCGGAEDDGCAAEDGHLAMEDGGQWRVDGSGNTSTEALFSTDFSTR